jgi:hypothetical protein
MLIKVSTKFNKEKEFMHEGREVVFFRTWGGLALVGDIKSCVVVGEENFYGTSHYYIIAEAETRKNEGIIEVIETARKFQAVFKVSRWLSRLDKNIQEIIDITTREMYSSGSGSLYIEDIPRVNETLDEQRSLLSSVSKKGRKRLHFFNESSIPGELKSFPVRDALAKDYPRTSALLSVLWGLMSYRPETTNCVLEPEFHGDY